MTSDDRPVRARSERTGNESPPAPAERRRYRPPSVRPFGRRLPAFGPPSPPPGEHLPPWVPKG